MKHGCIYVFKKGSQKNQMCMGITINNSEYCKKHLEYILLTIDKKDTYKPPNNPTTSDNCLWSPQEINIPSER